MPVLHIVESREYTKWFEALEDANVRAAIDSRILMIRRLGHFAGDFKTVGPGVIELRINKGPGYRIYTAIKGNSLLLLLFGGSKRRQGDDIARAAGMLADWEATHG